MIITEELKRINKLLEDSNKKEIRDSIDRIIEITKEKYFDDREFVDLIVKLSSLVY